jgi:deoxyadenosine/deoxycytidine kinase
MEKKVIEPKCVLIGIAGQMKSGKSSLASLLAQEFDLPVVSYAESLRMEVSQAFFHKQQKSEARFLWDMLEERDKTMTRPMLQAWGEARRNLNYEDYWVKRLRHYVESKGITMAIVDDVRHINEAEDILNNGGVIIRLSAKRSTLEARGAKGLEHSSEDIEKLDDYFAKRGSHGTAQITSDGRTPHGLFVVAKEMLGVLL